MANFTLTPSIVDGEVRIITESVNFSDSSDVYYFQVEDSSSVIHLNLYNIIGGDADLELYEDSNLNENLDSGDLLVSSSINGGSQEETIKILESSVNGRNLDSKYLIKVTNFEGSTVNYNLSVTITESTPEGSLSIPISPSSRSTFDGFISGNQSSNFGNFQTIEYNASTAGTIIGEIQTSFEGSDLNVKIFDDSNFNEVFDPRDELIAQQRITGQNGVISVPVEGGRGFVQLENLSDSGYSYNITAYYGNNGNPGGGGGTLLNDPIYRFYNPVSRGHFFTADSAERDTVLANPQWGYSYEGVGFNASNTGGDSLLPVYRFYNPVSQGHFFTINEAEKNNVLAHPEWGYKFENIGFYAYASNASLGSDVYRFYNPFSQGHFFTINEAEKNNVLAHPEWGYTFEGVAFEGF
jgi:hypothetical protein